MPKILINERDNTSPGAMGDYANYSVLIVGFKGEPKGEEADRIQPDSNGVYEFTSAQDFVNTIGKHGPDVSFDTTNGPKDGKHYGNQMAYELLNLGYTVIYKPIISPIELIEDKFWEIFKDKANYDFRFITHGLLETDVLSPESATKIAAWKEAIERNKVQKSFNNSQCEFFEQGIAATNADIAYYNSRQTVLLEAQGVLNGIRLSVKSAYSPDDAIGEEYLETVDGKTALNTKYLDILSTDEYSKGFIDPSNSEVYNNYEAAVAGVAAELSTLTTTITNAQADIESSKAAIADYTNKNAEIDAINSQYELAITNQEQAGFTENHLITANNCIANLATYVAEGAGNTNDMTSTKIPGRGDCIALIEMAENQYTTTSSAKPELLIKNAISVYASNITAENGKFCAMTVPSVYYRMADDAGYDNNKKFPGAFHYLACFKNSLALGFDEWFAAAGYTRGVSSYTVDHTSVKLGEIAINTLEPRNNASGLTFACNVIANFRGSYYLWGNRTAQPLRNDDLVASHFLNIRHLCTTIKKQLYVSCRRFTFDPNSDTLWINFVNAIKPTLERMKARQGIQDYKILKDTSNPKKATLKAKIRIIPIEAVEDFDIEVSLEDAFGETAVSTGDV